MLWGSRVVGSLVGVFLPGCDDGHPCVSTVPVPARLGRFGRVGQWRVPGRRLVGCLSRCAVRVTQPLRLIDSGYVQTVLPELDPGTRAAGRCWSRRAVAGHRPGFPLRCRWLTLCESPCFVRRVVWVRCPGQAPGTQVPKPPRCTTRAANRTYVLSRLFGECVAWCCSGGSNPIHIPERRAAGWFGVDPPHLRWLVALGALSRGA